MKRIKNLSGSLLPNQGGFIEVILLVVLAIIAILLTATACNTRLEEARARQKEAQIEIEREKTNQVRVEREIVEEQRRIEETKTELEKVKGDNFIKRAVAQDITLQSRMYALLQIVWAPLAIAALVCLGLYVLSLLSRHWDREAR